MTGSILTFYSYKGGTGRSMTVANTAWILASNGLRVLTLDWDLEAPGLHRYFYPFLPDPDLAASPGVIDLIWKFAEATMDMEAPDAFGWYDELAQISPYAMSIEHSFPDPGTIDFVPAGRQDATYSALVSQFDWNNFYERLGGGGFLEALKRNMRERYDYVLVDSRTGLSDTAGICTVQLPDILVNCFSLSNQAINGAEAVAASVYRQRRDGDLRIFPVPMRVEDGEQDKLDVSRDYARALFGRYLTHLADPERYWGEVEVPYKSFYAYEEILATIGDRSRQENTVLAATERIVGYLTDGRVTELAAAPSEPERRELLARFQRTGHKNGMSGAGSRPAAGGPRVFISYSYESADHFDAVRELWYLLRAGGIDARLDLPPRQRRDDWPVWLRNELDAADLILIIASAGYREAHLKPTGTDSTLAPEVRLVLPRAHRALGVVLPGTSVGDLPKFIVGSEHVVIQELTEAGVEPLRRQVVLLAVARAPQTPTSPIESAALDQVTDAGLQHAQLDLAKTIRRQLSHEASIRRLFDPFPMPVRWSATELPVAARTSQPSLSGSSSSFSELFLRLPQRRLVVLGAPGAGKTSAVIQFALDLLAARSAPDPVPVLLSAASWQPNSESLDDWITRRLEEDHPQLTKPATYGPDAARRLVDTRLVIPILDGLDELPPGLRGLAIHGLVLAGSDRPMLVTSRTREYEEAVTMTGRTLPAAAVIELRPMALDDVIDYLTETQPVNDQRWEQVLNRLRNHPDVPLARLLSTPMILDLARTIYTAPDTDPAELLDGRRFDSVASLQNYLLDSLIRVSYEGPVPAALPPGRQFVGSASANRWLVYLARWLEKQHSEHLLWWQLYQAASIKTTRIILGLAGFLFTTLVLGTETVLSKQTGQLTGWITGLGPGAVLGLLIAVWSQPPHLPRHLVRRPGLSQSGRPVPMFRLREWMNPSQAPSPQQTLRDDRTATVVPALTAAAAVTAAGITAIQFDLFSFSRGMALVATAIMMLIVIQIGRSAWGWFTATRCWLALRGQLPWRLMRFLDDAHERGILRQAGPAYQFRNVKLQQHLASKMPTVATTIPITAPSYEECKLAAESVRNSDRGPAAVAAVRGRGLSGLTRERPRLPILLYTAGLQGLLVWRSADCFALLQPPLADRKTFAGDGWRARWLGLLDRQWELVAAYAPAAVLLLLMPSALLFGQYAELVLLLLQVLVLLTVVVVMALMLVRPAVLALHRAVTGRATVTAAKVRRLLDDQWTTALLHARDASDVEPLLRSARERLAALVAGTEQARSAGPLLCRADAITWTEALAAAERATAKVYGPSTGVLLVPQTEERPAPAAAPVRRPPRMTLLMIFASIVTAVVMAQFVTEQERAACIARSCDGQPLTWLDALGWLLLQLAPGVDTAPAASAAVGFYGHLVNALGWTTLAVFVAEMAYVADFNRKLGTAVRQDLDEARTAAFLAAFGGVFVNHRWGPHRPMVAAISRSLAARFGGDKVFVDFRSLPPGEPYPDQLRADLHQARVLLAVIHPGWHEDLSRWVRFEIATALRDRKKVIPVLLDGVTWPPPGELPEDIGGIVLNTACRVRMESLDDDLDRLVTDVWRAATASWSGSDR